MTKYFSVCFFSFFLTLCSLRLFASPQMPDYIIFKGDTIATYNLILEQYLQRNDTTEQLFGLSFRNSTDGSFSFNCWRGYQAIYKIDNDSLFLVDIINFSRCRCSILLDYQIANECRRLVSRPTASTNTHFNYL
jgi:hypothetical protein